ncbi:MAG: hypothetical protein U9N80_15130 [Chloroflexota bacterium]|nr:hypothetical protein [Chloroflexota bacterium]
MGVIDGIDVIVDVSVFVEVEILVDVLVNLGVFVGIPSGGTRVLVGIHFGGRGALISTS